MPRVSVYIRPTTGCRTPKKATKESTGPFYLRYEVKGKRVWEKLTTHTYTFALADARSKESSLLREQTAPPKPSPATPKSLEELRTAFIHDKKTSRKKDGTLRDAETVTSYEQTITQFLATTGVTRASDVTREVLRNWKDGLYLHPYAQWTVCNIYSEVATFLKFCGVDHKKLLSEDERPSPVEETPEAYTEEEMTRFFFVVANEKHELAFQFLLKTGAREKEMTYLEWGDLHLHSEDGTSPHVKIQCKEGFRTKTGKNRKVPLEKALAVRLLAWREKNPTTRYVFGTKKDQPEGHYLRIMKDYAKAAGLDRDTFWLHKMRSTFCTWALRRKVDLRTVQAWAGHSDISVTARYLAPEQESVQQEHMNRVFASDASVATQ